MSRIIYADNAATTSVSKRALAAMMPFYERHFGNPSSIYSLGTFAKKALENARKDVAACLNANPDEVFFTSGGTESDNWAIKGVARLLSKKGKNHIVTSKFEHHAVLHTVKALEKEGFAVTYLDVYDNGLVKPEDVENAITEKTAIVSIMYANNEIGTIQPIKEIGEICRQKKVIFHTDAVQAVGHIPVDVKKDNVDLLSLSGHKFHGPKGIGALYIRKGTNLENLLEGGAQEFFKRAGTENVPCIVGMAEALKESLEEMENNITKITIMRNFLIENILKNIEGSILNGDLEHRLPGNVNISFAGIEGESLLLFLNEAGICASSGSACTSKSLDPSHVLLAIGLKHEIAHGSLRLTINEQNTKEDVENVAAEVVKVVNRLRQMSPLWEDLRKEENLIQNLEARKKIALSFFVERFGSLDPSRGY